MRYLLILSACLNFLMCYVVYDVYIAPMTVVVKIHVHILKGGDDGKALVPEEKDVHPQAEERPLLFPRPLSTPVPEMHHRSHLPLLPASRQRQLGAGNTPYRPDLCRTDQEEIKCNANFAKATFSGRA